MFISFSSSPCTYIIIKIKIIKGKEKEIFYMSRWFLLVWIPVLFSMFSFNLCSSAFDIWISWWLWYWWSSCQFQLCRRLSCSESYSSLPFSSHICFIICKLHQFTEKFMFQDWFCLFHFSFPYIICKLVFVPFSLEHLQSYVIMFVYPKVKYWSDHYFSVVTI